MVEQDDWIVTPETLACSKNFSPKVLAEGAELINKAREKFCKDGFVPLNIAQKMMKAEGIQKHLTVKGTVYVRNIDSHQWFRIDNGVIQPRGYIDI
ncbi:hypothetical protein QUB19_22980 [Microcoleus sp. B4-C5]|uniref:hypothetical protein n=1 Tax=unclassified Microcoleus TaxID=2642155 RepID=UPI002FCF6CC6